MFFDIFTMTRIHPHNQVVYACKLNPLAKTNQTDIYLWDEKSNRSHPNPTGGNGGKRGQNLRGKSKNCKTSEFKLFLEPVIKCELL